jgi:tetratricopeptide (TPR) repeat protein
MTSVTHLLRTWIIPPALMMLVLLGCQQKQNQDLSSRTAPDSLTVVAGMLLNKGVEYYSQGYYLKAIESYRQALSQYGDFPEAHYNMGLAFRRMNQIDSAIVSYGKALALKNDYPQALNNLAFIYLQYRPDLTQALPLAQRAVMLRPLNPDFLDTYARILFGMGEVDSAIVVLEKAIFLSEKPEEMQKRLDIYKSVQQTAKK